MQNQLDTTFWNDFPINGSYSAQHNHIHSSNPNSASGQSFDDMNNANFVYYNQIYPGSASAYDMPFANNTNDSLDSPRSLSSSIESNYAILPQPYSQSDSQYSPMELQPFSTVLTGAEAQGSPRLPVKQEFSTPSSSQTPPPASVPRHRHCAIAPKTGRKLVPAMTTQSSRRPTKVQSSKCSRPFLCEWRDCGMTFKKLSAWKQHQYVHTGEKPWTCEYCEKGLQNKSNLNRHYGNCKVKKALAERSPFMRFGSASPSSDGSGSF